ncbi:nucleoid-associated protein [Dysgonomonas sp. HGC4]|uniref:nucleoid-associated protein n=1 Tax=Dysgonomonas sp. HGC4 TaxID=1658009 RepID=UPI0006827979|nr:nucleoid-associated protein [Dysgonomonas sp. HGC4]MBD8347675.1 nucleoid-associated protein [Dysgonomonas sp. HGC4]
MNFNFIDANIDNISLHKVGNKTADEGYQLSKKNVEIGQELKKLLTHYFVSPFKSQESFSFWHITNLKYNEVHEFISEVFNDPDSLYNNSVNLAKYLYEKSIHPKIKGGEFYTVYFKNCIIDNQTVDAVGLFKSENKDTFLKIFPSDDNFEIESQQGVNINKLDKGCLIFNTKKDKGYVVLVVDNINKGSDVAHYWMDDFLQVKPYKNEYYYTENIISLCKNFTSNNLIIDKTQKADILNKAVSFFKENESFDMDDFSNQIMKEESMKQAFQQYRSQYEQDRDIIIADDFNISQQALKKQVRTIKNIIKLDNNFKISIDGDTRYLEKGYDEEKRMNFYKLYFRDEE